MMRHFHNERMLVMLCCIFLIEALFWFATASSLKVFQLHLAISGTSADKAHVSRSHRKDDLLFLLTMSRWFLRDLEN